MLAKGVARIKGNKAPPSGEHTDVDSVWGRGARMGSPFVGFFFTSAERFRPQVSASSGGREPSTSRTNHWVPTSHQPGGNEELVQRLPGFNGGTFEFSSFSVDVEVFHIGSINALTVGQPTL